MNRWAAYVLVLPKAPLILQDDIHLPLEQPFVVEQQVQGLEVGGKLEAEQLNCVDINLRSNGGKDGIESMFLCMGVDYIRLVWLLVGSMSWIEKLELDVGMGGRRNQLDRLIDSRTVTLVSRCSTSISFTLKFILTG
jgi:hypothetical protein